MSKGSGSKKTPEKLVARLKEAVADKSLSEVSRVSGIGIAAVHRYLKGIGEPTKATLEKLATYFGVSVAGLIGEEIEPPDDILKVVLDSYYLSDMPKLLKENMITLIGNDYIYHLNIIINGGDLKTTLSDGIISFLKIITVLSNYYKYQGAMGNNPYVNSPHLDPAYILFQQIKGMLEQSGARGNRPGAFGDAD